MNVLHSKSELSLGNDSCGCCLPVKQQLVAGVLEHSKTLDGKFRNCLNSDTKHFFLPSLPIPTYSRNYIGQKYKMNYISYLICGKFKM